MVKSSKELPKLLRSKYRRHGISSGNRVIVTAIAELGKSRWVATNRIGSHPASPRCATHAEVAVMGKIPRQSREKVILRVYRTRRDGTIGMAKPCVFCQAYLFRQGIKNSNVYWTNNNGEWERGL